MYTDIYADIYVGIDASYLPFKTPFSNHDSYLITLQFPVSSAFLRNNATIFFIRRKSAHPER